MKIQIIQKDNDGYITARVIDNENYLELFYNPLKGWNTSHGIVDNRNITQGNFRTTWKSNGKGKLSLQTEDKIEAMHQYFINNIVI